MWLSVSFILLLSSRNVFSVEEAKQNEVTEDEKPLEKELTSNDPERSSRGFKQVKLRTAEWEPAEEEYEGWATGTNDNVWAEEPEAHEDFDLNYYPGQQRPSVEGGERWEDTEDEEEDLYYPPQYPAYPQSPIEDEVSVLDFSDDKIIDPYETDDHWAADEEEAPKKTFPDPCRLKPCRNNGICSGYGKGRYRCLCPAGYFGRNCEQRVDPCQSNPCQNGGFCSAVGQKFRCSCPDGFSGRTCEYRVTPCSRNPCLNDGICATDGRVQKCICVGGWTGRRCELPPLSCRRNPCHHGGQCHSRGKTYTCNCRSGYAGRNCEIPPPICRINPCFNGGLCHAAGKGYTCQCPAGFTGGNCEVAVRVCQNNPCFNGGICRAISKRKYVCECSGGYQGKHCELSPPACLKSPCLNGGFCSSLGRNRVACDCPTGYTGKYCEIPPHCCRDNPCRNGGRCSARGTQAVCSCYGGWTGEFCEIPPNCCITSPCKNGGTCYNVGGLATCKCPVGYTGANCEIVENNCFDGYCLNGGACAMIDKVATCSCTAAYTGKRCENKLLLCDSNGCVCSENPCTNGGQCVVDGNQTKCICPASFSGKYCEVPKFECTTTYCQCGTTTCYNGGVCYVDEHHQVGCKCPWGFSGASCEYVNNVCDDPLQNPCKNGGICKINWYLIFGLNGGASVFTPNNKLIKDNLNSFICECPAGFYGPTCSETKQVSNCPDGVCGCPPGFRLATGGICIDDDECYISWLNSFYDGHSVPICGPWYTAGCTNTVGSYKCSCSPGYAIGADGKCQRIVKWSTVSNRCGSFFPLSDGRPSECDPFGIAPCCSANGFCGTGEEFCTCEGCVDYSQFVLLESTLPGNSTPPNSGLSTLTVTILETLKTKKKIKMVPTLGTARSAAQPDHDKPIEYEFSFD